MKIAKKAFFYGLLFHFAFVVLMVADTYQINLGFFHQTTELLVLMVLGWVLVLPYGLTLLEAGGRTIFRYLSRATPENLTKPL